MISLSSSLTQSSLVNFCCSKININNNVQETFLRLQFWSVLDRYCLDTIRHILYGEPKTKELCVLITISFSQT